MKRDRPSRTAESVAQNVLLLSYDPELGNLVSPQAVEATRWCLGALPGAKGRSVGLYERGWFRAFARARERRFLPGISVHNAARKRWIERGVRELLSDGASQVVVLGAGYDTLGYRLHREYAEVTWWEVDHPATQAVKRRALEEHGSVGDNLRLLPADFANQTLRGLLEPIPEFHSTARTVFVAEGLLMYLSEAEVEELLVSVRELSGEGSGIVGTMLLPNPSGRLMFQGGSRLVELSLKLVGEPFQWGLPPKELPQFLAAHGFLRVEVAYVRDVLSDVLSEVPSSLVLPEGEYLFKAEL